MQTAYYTFKEHPNFSKIKFVILPKTREIISHSSGVPGNIDSTISELKDLFPNLDDSELDKYSDRLHYFLEDIDPHMHDEIAELKAYKENDVTQSNVFDLIIERAKGEIQRTVESNLNILRRVNATKKLISEYISTLAPDEKVVLVSHYFFLMTWTGEWHGSMANENGDLRQPDSYIHFGSSDIYYDDVKILEFNELEEKSKCS